MYKIDYEMSLRQNSKISLRDNETWIQIPIPFSNCKLGKLINSGAITIPALHGYCRD